MSVKKLLTIFCLVLLVSCSNEVLEEKLVYRNGLYYDINSTTPFTGQSVKYWRDIELSKNNNLVVVEEIRERISYKNGKKDGLHESFYENNQFKFGRNYKNGELDGLWVEYYENGQLNTKGDYKNGEMDGVQEWFYKNGKLSQKTNYKNGEMNGLYETYHENGLLMFQVHYINGKKEGVYKEYSSRGVLIKHIDYSFNPDYRWSHEEEDGVFRRLGWGIDDYDYDYNKNTKTGIREGFDSNGQLVRKVHFDKGTEGITEFYEDGKLSKKGRYNLQGQYDGIWEYFEKSSRLDKKIHYKDGQQGLYEFYEYGKLEQTGQFNSEGKYDGIWKNFNTFNGSVLSEKCYQNNNLVEMSFCLNEDSKITNYSLSTLKDDGLLEYRGTFRNGEKEGLWEYYYENGKLERKGNYKNGKMNGFWENYDENGQYKGKQNYKYGIKDGPYEFSSWGWGVE